MNDQEKAPGRGQPTTGRIETGIHPETDTDTAELQAGKPVPRPYQLATLIARQGICHVSQMVPAVLADFCFRLQASHANHQQAAGAFIGRMVIEKSPTREELPQ